MRSVVLLFLSIAWVLAADIEILSGKIDLNGTIITAHDDVVVLYDDRLIAAKKMRFDRTNKILDLEGDIHLIQGSMYYAIGEKLHMDINQEQSVLSPLFLHEKSNDLWIVSKEAKIDKGVYVLENATLSSCNPEDPEWRVKYSSGTYDTKNKWVNLHNMVIYAGDIPLFYLPWYGFTTNDKRTTGFLKPGVGWSELEGFFFEQPFYFVGSDRWDFELRYQLRSLRGEGVFSTLRFADAPMSHGSINFGYFREKNDQQAVLGWVNTFHHGVELDYDHTHFLDSLLPKGTVDKVYADLNYYNDVDYINLQLQDGQTPQTSNSVTSKLNYIISGNSHYLGVYSKLFYDTSNFDNLNTLQELPQLQYHKYTSSLFLERLTYSVDYNALNRTRPYLSSAFESLITVPITYTLPLFSEYLNFSLRENLTFSKINFSKVTNSTLFQDGSYLSGYQVASFYTDLTKKYAKNIHVMNIGMSYQFPGIESKSGFYTNSNGEFTDTNCQVGEPCEFAQGSIEPFQRTLNANFSQFVYDSKGKEFIYHKVTQPLDVENNSLGTLENEIRVQAGDSLSLYNNLRYSFENQNIEKSLSSISYNSPAVQSRIDHLYINESVVNNYSNYYSFSSHFGPLAHYSYDVAYEYDALRNRTRGWKLGLSMKKRCWSYAVSYTENVRPTSTASVTDRFIYFRIELTPVAGLDYQHNIVN